MSDQDPAPPPSNRRSSDRYLACTMAAVERESGQQRPALVHDLSESGALLLMRTTKIRVDDDVTLHLYVAEDPEEARTARGTVVRVEEVAPGDSGPWLRRVGIRFQEPMKMRADEIEGFRRRAQRLGLSS